MKAKVKRTRKGFTLSIDCGDAEFPFAYAFMEGVSDGINYPQGGVIVRSVTEPAYSYYRLANAIGRQIDHYLRVAS